MVKNLLMIIEICIIIAIIIWMRKKSRDRKIAERRFIEEYKKELSDSMTELLNYLNNFKSPVPSKQYRERLINTINANKKLIIALRQYSDGKTNDYEFILENLIRLESNNYGFGSLYERRLEHHSLQILTEIALKSKTRRVQI